MRLTLTALLISVAAPAFAQEPMAMPMAKPACPAQPAPLPPELAAWGDKHPLAGAATVAAAPAVAIALSYTAALKAESDVTFPFPPKRPAQGASFAGLFKLTIDTAGTYRIALGTGAWVDVIAGGAAQTAVAHGRGPDCTGIRKMVDFTLAPGTYFIALSGNHDATLGLMVTRLS